MFHIFTTLPTDMMIELHDVEQFPETLDTIESFLFWFIPLSCDNVDIPDHAHISRTDFRRCFQQKLEEIIEIPSSTEDNLVLRIAELTLDLCKEYLFVPDNVLFSRQEFEKTYLPKATYIKDSFEKMSNELNPFVKYVNELRAKVFVREELKQFLVLSHFYLYTHKDIIMNANWNDFLNAINDKRDAGDDVSTKLGNYKKCDPLFLKAFLMEPSNRRFGWVNRKVTEQGEQQKVNGILRTILDLPILTSIIDTSSEKWNPFAVNLSMKKRKKSKIDNANNQKLKNKRTDENFKGLGLDLKRYLEKHTWMFFDYEVAQKKVDYVKTKFLYCTSEISLLYDQFILERLASINFISALYDLFEKVPKRTVWTLSRFISSPLVNFRLKLIAYHERMQADEAFRKMVQIPSNGQPPGDSEWDAMLMGDGAWISCLGKILDYQLNCTLPILEIVYHYLFALIRDAHKGEEYETIEKRYFESVKSYLTELSSSRSYSFYSKTKSGYLVPLKSTSSAPLFGANNKMELNTNFKEYLPFLTSNHLIQPPFPNFCREVYLSFYEDIIYRCKNNLFQKIGSNITKERIDRLAIQDLRFFNNNN